MKSSPISKNSTWLKFSRHLFATTVLSIGTLFGMIESTLHPLKALIVGPDVRVTPAYEWMIRPGQPRTAVGQLETQMANGQYALCTFTVVGRNIGLTNTHCLLDEQGGKTF